MEQIFIILFLVLRIGFTQAPDYKTVFETLQTFFIYFILFLFGIDIILKDNKRN